MINVRRLSINCASSTAPVLAYPRISGEFTVDTDSSSEGICGILLQNQDGEERVINRVGRSTNLKEISASIEERFWL